MDRREFLKRAGLIASGAVAADQLGLLEQLLAKGRSMVGWTRPPLMIGNVRFIHKSYSLGFVISEEMIADDVMYPGDLLYKASDNMIRKVGIADYSKLLVVSR